MSAAHEPVRLAFAYARRRPLSTLLVVVLLAIGVATVTLTLILSHELEDRLARDAAGIDLVVGAKGSPLQLVLAGVYHVDVPPGNIPLAAIAALRANPLIAKVIPLALGDSFRGYRIVGTEPAFIDHYGGVCRRASCGESRWKQCSAARSRAARARSRRDVHRFAWSGRRRRRARGRAVPGTGILAPTGTVIDRLVVTSLESVWAVHERIMPSRSRPGSRRPAGQGARRRREEIEPEREVTLALVRFAARWPRPASPERSTRRRSSSPRRRPTRRRACSRFSARASTSCARSRCC